MNVVMYRYSQLNYRISKNNLVFISKEYQWHSDWFMSTKMLHSTENDDVILFRKEVGSIRELLLTFIVFHLGPCSHMNTTNTLAFVNICKSS